MHIIPQQWKEDLTKRLRALATTPHQIIIRISWWSFTGVGEDSKGRGKRPKSVDNKVPEVHYFGGPLRSPESVHHQIDMLRSWPTGGCGHRHSIWGTSGDRIIPVTEIHHLAKHGNKFSVAEATEIRNSGRKLTDGSLSKRLCVQHQNHLHW